MYPALSERPRQVRLEQAAEAVEEEDWRCEKQVAEHDWSADSSKKVELFNETKSLNRTAAHLKYILSPAILLVVCEVYIQSLPSHWSHLKYVLTICHPIGRM